MTKLPKVSIIIPCYNVEMFIDETLRSCVEQTYPNIEVIIVDDGSTDKSISKIREWKSKYPFIHVYEQENGGACKARNLAFEKSTGDYIMYLDADDIIAPDKIEKQVYVLLNKPFDTISTGPWDRFYNTIKDAKYINRKIYNNYESGVELLLDMWENSEMFAVTSYLIHRSLISINGPWNEKLLKNQDGEFMMRILLNTKHITFCPDAFFYYRSGEYDSVSKANSKAKIESLLFSFILYKKNILEVYDTPKIRIALGRLFSSFIYLYYNKYRELSNIAEDEINSLGIKVPIEGTKLSKLFSYILGYKRFLKMRGKILNR